MVGAIYPMRGDRGMEAKDLARVASRKKRPECPIRDLRVRVGLIGNNRADMADFLENERLSASC